MNVVNRSPPSRTHRGTRPQVTLLKGCWQPKGKVLGVTSTYATRAKRRCRRRARCKAFLVGPHGSWPLRVKSRASAIRIRCRPALLNLASVTRVLCSQVEQAPHRCVWRRRKMVGWKVEVQMVTHIGSGTTLKDFAMHPGCVAAVRVEKLPYQTLRHCSACACGVTRRCARDETACA